MSIWRKRQSTNQASPLLEMIQGYRATCLIAAAMQLDLVERLAAGPLAAEALASALGAHLPSLRRFLRALSAIGLVVDGARGVELTATGRELLKHSPGAWHWAVLTAEEYLPVWTRLRHSVLTGAPAFDEVFGMSAWDHRRQRTDLNAAFNAMGDRAARTLPALTAAHDFSVCGLIVDVGGGQGQLLAGLLAAYPKARGLLFDQPHVIADAEHVRRDPRCETGAGSFFDAVPKGGDVYILQHVLHDWDDAAATTILRNCRAAMDASSTLLIVEHVLPDHGEPPLATVMLDIHMLVVLGGRERTRREYETLLRSAGLELIRVTQPSGGVGVLAARPSAAAPETPARSA